MFRNIYSTLYIMTLIYSSSICVKLQNKLHNEESLSYSLDTLRGLFRFDSRKTKPNVMGLFYRGLEGCSVSLSAVYVEDKEEPITENELTCLGKTLLKRKSSIAD